MLYVSNFSPSVIDGVCDVYNSPVEFTDSVTGKKSWLQLFGVLLKADEYRNVLGLRFSMIDDSEVIITIFKPVEDLDKHIKIPYNVPYETVADFLGKSNHEGVVVHSKNLGYAYSRDDCYEFYYGDCALRTDKNSDAHIWYDTDYRIEQGLSNYWFRYVDEVYKGGIT